MSLFGFGDAINGIASIGTSLINRHSQKETNKRQLEMMRESNEFNAEQALINRNFQAEEAEKARQFNSLEAETARQFQQKMYEDEKAYNSPLNQLRMAQQAGLNPSGFDGPVASASAPSNGSVASGSPSPSGSSASSVAPPHLTSPTLANPSLNLDNMLKRAQIDNIQANTEKQQEETLTIEALRAPTVAYQNVLVETGRASIRWTDAQCEGMKANIENLNSITSMNRRREDEITQHIAVMKQDEFEKLLNNQYAIETFAERLRSLELDNDLKEKEKGYYDDLARKLYVDYLKAKKENDMLGIQLWIDRKTSGFKIKSQEVAYGQQRFDFSQNKTYDDITRSVAVAGQIVNMLGDAVMSAGMWKAAGALKGGFKAAKTVNTMKSIPGTNIPDLGSSVKQWTWH